MDCCCYGINNTLKCFVHVLEARKANAKNIIIRSSNLHAGCKTLKTDDVCSSESLASRAQAWTCCLVREVGQVGIMYLLWWSHCPRKWHGRSVPWNLGNLSQKTVRKPHRPWTNPSTRNKILSRQVAMLFATAFTSKGSKRAASSSSHQHTFRNKIFRYLIKIKRSTNLRG